MLTFLCCLLLQETTATETAPPPLYRVARVDPQRWETVYVTRAAKAEELDESENFQNVRLLGYGSDRPGPGLVPLFEAYRDGWHIYYTELPRGQQLPGGTKVQRVCYVWKRNGAGRIPVYGVSGQDWRNMRYSTDRDEIKEILESARRVKNVRLKNHGIVFYLQTPEQRN